MSDETERQPLFLITHHSPLITHHFLMKYVVILKGAGCAPARGVSEALRAAGVSATALDDSAEARDAEAARVRSGWEGEPLAVLFDVEAGADMAELHMRVLRAQADW